VQGPLAQITWYQNVALLEKLEHPKERLWYAHATVAGGWSRDVLVLKIKQAEYLRQGKAVTNFKQTLPPANSDMAAQIFKDPYLFDFLGTADPRREKEVEQALIDHVQKFLLELGSGFAFVGQLNLYLSAADDLLRRPGDNPAIGLLLCKSKNKIVVEYALRHLKRPIGVSEWETRIAKSLPKELRGSLPTVEELEKELK